MARTIILLALTAFFFSSVQAQQMSWRKHKKMAEELLEQAQYADAAEHFEQAWKKKSKKKDLIFKAAEAYYIVKEYRKAAEAYKNVSTDYKKYPTAGLEYARCLKQDGQYDEAIEEFLNFVENYTGEGQEILSEVVQREIEGCSLGREMASMDNPDGIQLEHLGTGVNTPETEFAPIPYNDNVLYFSSTMGERAKIYLSYKQEDGEWSKANIPESFPVVENGHFCNGSLTPDGGRFYFTICQSLENWGALTAQCAIYTIKKTDSGWTSPEKLRDYINNSGSTTTHPYVIHRDGSEILYFSSNREGTLGGMDIWYATRDLNSDDIDFTFPVNLGSKINSLGDDLSPYYDTQEGILYFSSNGLVSTGGQDIFKARGGETKWETPENLGTPFNSSADDYYFILNSSRTGGYLVSNRLFGMEKITTTHEDIFSFALQPMHEVILKGDVFEKESQNLLSDITVSIYEIDDNHETLLLNQSFEDGSYAFELIPNKRFKVEIQRDGYYPAFYMLDSFEPDPDGNYGELVYLEKHEEELSLDSGLEDSGLDSDLVDIIEEIEIPYQPPAPPTVVEESSGIEYTARGLSSHDSFEYITSAPRLTGTYYKVQIGALKNVNTLQNRYDPVRVFGRLDTEYITKKDLTRILVGDFLTKSEAKNAMQEIRRSGFSEAFMVRYDEGVRYGRVN